MENEDGRKKRHYCTEKNTRSEKAETRPAYLPHG